MGDKLRDLTQLRHISVTAQSSSISSKEATI